MTTDGTYRPGARVTTAEELVDDVVFRDRFGDIGVVKAGLVHYPETAPWTPERAINKFGPLTVLFRPDAPQPAATDDADREVPFWRDLTTGEPCPRSGPVLCTITDRDHLHRAIHMDDASAGEAVDREAAARALRAKATAYRQAAREGYLFLGDDSDRVPWEAVAQDLEADADRLAARGDAATPTVTAEQVADGARAVLNGGPIDTAGPVIEQIEHDLRVGLAALGIGVKGGEHP